MSSEMSSQSLYVSVLILTVLVVNDVQASPATKQSDAAFFNVNGNLTKIDWAHAVNDREYLDKTLASSVMFIEADIVMGHLITNLIGPEIPVMAHPPAVLSDLSLEEFLSSINKFNQDHPIAQKGVKLDFKSIEAFEAAQTQLLSYNGPEITYPIWLNADILSGPVDSSTIPVDATRFLKISASYPKSVLSIGWTTNFGGTITKGEYSQAHVDDMLNTLKNNHVELAVTFPVRAALAAESFDQMSRLLRETEKLNSTLTVWSSSEGDAPHIDYEKLRYLIVTIGYDKVYLDVTESVANKLHLP